MTAPDIDVRACCPPTPAKAGDARRFALARLLLKVLRTVRQLDRRLLLLFATSLLPACIIPVGPEFQDPLGVPNSAPRIVNPIPTWGEEVTGTADNGYTFRFTATDADSDILYVRFLVDKFLVATSPGFVSGSKSGSLVETRITCPLIMNPESKMKSSHKVLAAVADTMFDIDVQDPLTPEPPGLVSTPVTWTLNMTCQTTMSPGSPTQ